MFQDLTGLPSDPDATTLRRFLRRVAPTALPKLRVLYDRCLHRMTVQPRPPSRLIFDVDSTGLVVSGKEEHARIGDTPVTRGRPSYHPLLSASRASARTSGMASCGPAMRIPPAGHSTSSPACVAKIPARVRAVIARADKGCDDHPLVDGLEAHQAGFVSVARLTAPIQRKLLPRRSVCPSPGIEGAEFRSQPFRWSKPSRFVVIRRP